jgi:N-acyl-D-amino-acid deacylase
MANTLEMIRWAREEGIDVQMDMMPCTQNHTALAAIVLPSWVFGLDMKEVAELLTSAEGRKKLKANHRSMWQLVTDGKWDRIYLFSTNQNRQYIGMTMEEIGEDRGSDPHDVAFDLLLEEGANARHVFCVGDSFSDDDNKLVLQDPYCAVASDGIGLAQDGILADTSFSPLTYNYYSHFFETYIKEKKWLTLEEGVRRCTSLPASQMGIADRGVLRSGAAADIVVFDPERYCDESSIENPNVYPGGVEYVIVNGQVEVESGQRQPRNTGQVIRRTG